MDFFLLLITLRKRQQMDFIYMEKLPDDLKATKALS